MTGPGDVLVLSASDVEACLPMVECIDAMADALVAVSAGKVHNPLRTTLMPPFDSAPGLLALMPAISTGDEWIYGLKEVCVFPGNHDRGVDSHQGSVLLHEGETGRLVAVMNGTAVTAVRTAAVTAVASRLLARPDSGTLALIGVGHQARWHLESLAHVHDLQEIRVCARTPGSAEAFAARWADRYPVRVAETTEDAVRGADIITTVTSSSTPVVDRSWIAPGAHINAVGSCSPIKRELDTATVAAARLFVDRRESTLAEAGDYLMASEEAVLGPAHIVAEVGEVLAGDAEGRATEDEVTLFESLGLAIEDVAAARVVVANARRNGVGTVAPF